MDVSSKTMESINHQGLCGKSMGIGILGVGAEGFASKSDERIILVLLYHLWAAWRIL